MNVSAEYISTRAAKPLVAEPFAPAGALACTTKSSASSSERAALASSSSILVAPSFPLPIYSAPGACFKPRVVPHNSGRSRNILAGWVRELRVPTYYGSEVRGFAQDDTGVDVGLSDGRSLQADYLVGCDGGRSLIRKAAGIELPGWDPTTRHLIAEVELVEEPEWGLRRDALGGHSLSRMGVR